MDNYIIELNCKFIKGYKNRKNAEKKYKELCKQYNTEGNIIALWDYVNKTIIATTSEAYDI